MGPAPLSAGTMPLFHTLGNRAFSRRNHVLLSRVAVANGIAPMRCLLFTPLVNERSIDAPMYSFHELPLHIVPSERSTASCAANRSHSGQATGTMCSWYRGIQRKCTPRSIDTVSIKMHSTSKLWSTRAMSMPNKSYGFSSPGTCSIAIAKPAIRCCALEKRVCCVQATSKNSCPCPVLGSMRLAKNTQGYRWRLRARSPSPIPATAVKGAHGEGPFISHDST
jgi:hypothetical protein